MDVHARSVTAKALNKTTGELSSKRFGAGYSSAEIIEWLDTLEGPILCAYESGCTGFWLARELNERGFDCEVIAISTLARSLKDRKSKCDRLDARAILREMTNPLKTYSCVYIPDERTEAERDLCRARTNAAARLKKARQELASFLLRHGYAWNERTSSGNLKKPIGRSYETWLDGISFKEALADEVFSFLRMQIRVEGEALERIETLMRRAARSEENKPYVEALCLMKGIDEMGAMLIKAEIGSFSRFASARKVSSWIGCVPSDHSSGERQAHGKITKAGNKYVRRTLIEGAASLPNWKRQIRVGPKEGVSAAIVIKADDANERLFKRYRYLKEVRNKHANKARIAIVNEMIRWIWVIGLMVEQEQSLKSKRGTPAKTLV